MLREAVERPRLPGRGVEVGRRDGARLARTHRRTLTYDPMRTPATTGHTIFDLASLTKVIATTTLVMRAVDAGG